jgi:hypothetical protein
LRRIDFNACERTHVDRQSILIDWPLPDPVLRLLGDSIVYHVLGRKEDSDTALDELVAQYQDSAAAQIAEAYAFRGESDKAFQWLDRAYVQHDGALATTNLLKDLHGDPRYLAFLKKIHLPS